MKKINEKIINKHILEVRHKTYMKFLDIKGDIANFFIRLNRFNFIHWRLSVNRVDFMDASGKIKTFASLTNFGIVIEDAPSLNYFKDQSILFLKDLLKFPGFSDRDITRLGIRSFFLVDRKQKFNDIKRKYQDNFLDLKPKSSEIFDADLIDIAAPFNFKEKNNKSGFNTMSGPMKKNQMKRFFADSKLYPDNIFPESALYFDIDYYTKDIGKKDKENLLKIVKNNIIRSTDIFIKFKDYVLE